MRDSNQTSVPRWPFFVGDVFLLGLAYFIYWQATLPLGRWEIAAAVVCAGLGALLGVLPFLLEHRAVLKLIETSAIGSAVEKIQSLESVAAQIGRASGLWENANQQADKTAAAAKEISDQMASELAAFKEFIQKANDSEKATLRLEVEKLRRAEAEWLQILVRMLDHVFALHLAAERSGQENVIAQVGQFQNACRDTARRIGLVPFVAAQDERFDPQRHKWADGEQPESDSVVTETLATGFTFQGRLVRPALVRVQQNGSRQPEESAERSGELPLESVEAAESES